MDASRRALTPSWTRAAIRATALTIAVRVRINGGEMLARSRAQTHHKGRTH
jgi:hypothetical protein